MRAEPQPGLVRGQLGAPANLVAQPVEHLAVDWTRRAGACEERAHMVFAVIARREFEYRLAHALGEPDNGSLDDGRSPLDASTLQHTRCLDPCELVGSRQIEVDNDPAGALHEE